MIQFNIHRFRKLAQWSLTCDKSFYLRKFLQVFVLLTLLFLANTTNFFQFNVNGANRNYAMCSVITIAVLLVNFIIGPSTMFTSMKGKHDLQVLLMLPASNFEKYLMRYSTWIVLMPIYLVAFFSADLIQYAVNTLMGSENVLFVTTDIYQRLSSIMLPVQYVPAAAIYTVIIFSLSLHSCYVLGGTFFRSNKYAWILTTLVLIVLCMLLLFLSPEKTVGISSKASTHELVIEDVIYVLWLFVNFWLSYRLFCRTQAVGKFVNL